MPRIHPTAIIDASARLGDEVEVAPYAIIEGDVTIGPGTRVGEHAVIRRYTSLGAGNVVDAGVVLGGCPQDLKFDPQTISYLRIGDANTFREGVTISRATGEGKATVVGSRTYWMAGTHAGHNATIEDDAIFVNGSAVAGHATVGRGVIFGGGAKMHQFCWIGTRAMAQGNASMSMHVPPYCLAGDGLNHVIGLNVVGLRRNPDLTADDRRQIHEAFNILYRSGHGLALAVEKMDACRDWGKAASAFRDFARKVLTAVKPYNRGLMPLRYRRRDAEPSL